MRETFLWFLHLKAIILWYSARFSASIYLLKVNDRNTRKMCSIFFEHVIVGQVLMNKYWFITSFAVIWSFLVNWCIVGNFQHGMLLMLLHWTCHLIHLGSLLTLKRFYLRFQYSHEKSRDLKKEILQKILCLQMRSREN